MRIRTKLLVFLLIVVLTPLCSLGWYAWRQTDHLGRQLANSAATALEANAAKELVQTAEMLEETCANNLNMLETALSLVSEEAGRLLRRPVPVPNSPILFDKDFEAGAVPADRMTPPPGTDVPCTYDHLVFHLPPGLLRAEARPETSALSGLLPIFKTLFARHKDLMQFGYVGLASGLHCAYPGHGGYPDDFDPRTRPWYKSALAEHGITWSVMVDAVTKQVTATMAMPIRRGQWSCPWRGRPGHSHGSAVFGQRPIPGLGRPHARPGGVPDPAPTVRGHGTRGGGQPRLCPGEPGLDRAGPARAPGKPGSGRHQGRDLGSGRAPCRRAPAARGRPGQPARLCAHRRQGHGRGPARAPGSGGGRHG
jgi:hypothetical protein